MAFVFSNALLWLTYYVVNYNYGFVRRGLAGELIRMFPESHYFTAAYSVLWSSIFVWLIALALLVWQVLSGGVFSERRAMLALLIPVLPFSFSYAAYTPHPELFGMAALVVFSIIISRLRSCSSRMILSLVYGVLVAVLALMHEGIPLELGLGSILAIIVLANDSTRAMQRFYTIGAVIPGVISVLLAAAFGRHDIAPQLCAQVPHGMIENPWAVSVTPEGALKYILGETESRSDYHAYACRYATPVFNVSLSEGVQGVITFGKMHFGYISLTLGFLLGMLYLACTMWSIRYLTGIAISGFLNRLRGNLLLPILASMMVVPLFMTGTDWTRWWILITFDMSLVYILYAITQPQIERQPSRRNVLVLVCLVAALSVIPTGSANNVGLWAYRNELATV